MMLSYSFNFPKTPKHMTCYVLLALFSCASHFANADTYCAFSSDPFCVDEVDVTGYKTDSDYLHYNIETPGFFPNWPNASQNNAQFSNQGGVGKAPYKQQSPAKSVKDNVLDQPASSNSVEHTCHPVTISTGTKFLDEIDFIDVGDNPLRIDRHYAAGTHGIFGYGWTTSLDDRLDFTYFIGSWSGSIGWIGSTSCKTIPGLNNKTCADQLFEAGKSAPGRIDYNIAGIRLIQSAQVIVFASAPGAMETGTTLSSGNSASITKLDASNYKVTFQNGDVEIFDSTYGLPKSKVDVNGIGWTYDWDSSSQHRLRSVTHTSGKKLVFTWIDNDDKNAQVSTVTDPNGFVTWYTPNIYGSSSFGKMGTVGTVTYPNSAGTRIYSYTVDSKAPMVPLVTGISVDGVQNTAYSYYPADTQGRIRVSSSGLVGGIDKSSFTYTDTTSTVTNAMGASTTYTYRGDRTLSGISRPGSGACPYASTVAYTYQPPYDSSYTPYPTDDLRNVLSKTDWKGNVTSYTYYPTDRPPYSPSGTVKTETDSATGNTINYTWDTYNRLLQLTLTTSSGAKRVTTNTYYGADKYNRLASTSIADELGNVRTTSYDYTFLSNGLVKTKTVKGARTDISNDITTYNYNDRGDLLSIVDAAGNTTQYVYDTTTFDRPNSVIDANGTRTYFTYDGKYRIVKTSVADSSNTLNTSV